MTKLNVLPAVPTRKAQSMKDKRAYLADHFRYYTMNSWNGLTSFARNVKINRIDFGDDKEAENRAYSFLECAEAFYEVNDILEEFASDHEGYSIGSNGRSGGYFVLYQAKTSRGLEYDEEMSNYEVNEMYKLVWDFDQTVKRAVGAFVEFCLNNKPVEATAYTPHTIIVAEAL